MYNHSVESVREATSSAKVGPASAYVAVNQVVEALLRVLESLHGSVSLAVAVLLLLLLVALVVVLMMAVGEGRRGADCAAAAAHCRVARRRGSG
jgi:hypothetical protein